MTNANEIAVLLLVDDSGSMRELKSATVEGVNSFLTDLSSMREHVYIQLTTFNSDINELREVVHVRQCPPIMHADLLTTGSTALLDAIGISVKKLGEQLAALTEDERPGKVVVCVITDGEENASTQYTHEQIKATIQHQQDVYKWEFKFLGANIDAFKVARSMGISVLSTAQYDSNLIGVKTAYCIMGNMVKGTHTA